MVIPYSNSNRRNLQTWHTKQINSTLSKEISIKKLHVGEDTDEKNDSISDRNV
jgi:hypothetical protein